MSTIEDGSREQLELAALAAIELQNRKYADDPWLWATQQVRTQDEASQELRRFPFDKVYLKDLFWILENKNMIVVPKSRRMFVSWAMATWVTWRIWYHKYNAIFWQSLQESKAAYVVNDRIKFIEDNLEPVWRKEYEATKTKTGLVGKLTYKDTGSFVLAIPQGDDTIRSYTPSVLIMDESEHQPEGPAAIKAALSTVEKNAKIILVGTSDGPGHPIADICAHEHVGFMSFPRFYGKSQVTVNI